MRQPNNRRFRKGTGVEPFHVLLGLIAVNIIMYFFIPRPVEIAPGRYEVPAIYDALTLSWRGLQAGRLWQIVTSMFMHGDFWHIALNMWGLFIFGQLIVNQMGILRFFLLYMISGIFGNLLWLLFNWGSQSYLLGASGALFGVMLAVAMFMPNAQFMLMLPPVPVRARTLVIIFGVIEVISELGKGGNVAHLAHLGGFIGAYIFLKAAYGNRMEWDPLGFMFGNRAAQKPRPRAASAPPPSRPSYRMADDADNSKENITVSARQVDEILDKLSRSGPNSLTDEERAVLNEARKKYSKH